MIFSKSHNSYLRMISEKEREIKDKEPIIINGEILAVTQKTEVVPEHNQQACCRIRHCG